ncbi:MAG: DUF885 domain-containing protein [Clostridiales bacterium]|nr:DUF885 domain-containing protein [Clostridiales bacterium]
MKRFAKVIALLAALILFASSFSGCKLPDGSETQTVIVGSAEQKATPTPEATATPAPTFVVDETTTAAFDALDLEVFRWYATMDGYSYHMFVDDPANFGIDPSTVKMTFGEFTTEDSDRIAVEAEAYLTQLDVIDREQLPQKKQLSYDVLHQILEDFSDDTDYDYFYEPLTEYSGLHSSMPLSFALFELKDTQDIEDYLALLADMPRYMGQVLAYEQQRAELGMFMTEGALDAILEDCQAIIDTKDTSFLYVTFNDGIDQLTTLTAEQAQTYKDRNASLIQHEYIDAYQTLYDGLDALRDSCRSYEEAARYDERQKSYFEYSMQDAGCNSLSVEETLEMLKTEANYMLYQFFTILDANPDIYDTEIDLTSGNLQTDLDDLQTLIQPLLPALPEHNLTLTDVPEELQNQFAPAAYVIPSMDDWQDNTIYINTATKDPTPLFTLAHEGYPGHMYQYVYQRGMDDLGLMQRAANFGGYAEGWAQFAEFLYVENQTTYDQDYVHFQFDYSMLVSSILPAIVSIMVNYYGYSQDAVASYLTGMSLNGESLAELYYKSVVDQPYYFFEYAIGYSQLAQLYRDELNDLGDDFEMSEFLKAYLDLGPGYFDLIRERMDIWADEFLQDAAA